MNVPDDWDSYWYTCSACGGRYHASELGCDCDERKEDDVQRLIAEQLQELADGIEVEFPVVDLGHGLSKQLGYHGDGDPAKSELRLRKKVLGAIARTALELQAELEVCAYNRDAGDSWTVEIMSGGEVTHDPT